MLIADGRCHLPMCTSDTVYSMVGRCLNCHIDPVLLVFTDKHSTRQLRCPACGCPELKSLRRASVDEISSVLSGV